MKTTPLTLILAVFALTASACTIIDGNGVLVEERRPLSAFSEVAADGPIQIDIQVDPDAQTPFAIALSGDENLMPYVATRLEGHRLIIEETEWLSPAQPLRATLTVPRLRGIDVSDSASIIVRGVHRDTLRVRAAGHSRVVLQGEVESLSIASSGSAHIDALDLVAWSAHVDLVDNASVEVCVEETLEISASGFSTLTFACNPFHVIEDTADNAHVQRY